MLLPLKLTLLAH